jgi:hypothetical protein
MQWIKNNLVCLIIILVLVCAGAWGVCFAGQRILEAQNLAGKLARDLDREYRYSVTAKQLIDRCIEYNIRIKHDLDDSIRYNQQLNERVSAIERNSREALGLLESAAHR